MRNHNSRPHIELIDLITQYQLCTVKKRFEIYRKQLTKSNKIYAFISLSVIVSRCVNRKKIHLIVGRYCGIGDTLNPAALSVLEEHLFIHTRACVPSSTFNFFFRFFFFVSSLLSCWAVNATRERTPFICTGSHRLSFIVQCTFACMRMVVANHTFGALPCIFDLHAMPTKSCSETKLKMWIWLAVTLSHGLVYTIFAQYPKYSRMLGTFDCLECSTFDLY